MNARHIGLASALSLFAALLCGGFVAAGDLPMKSAPAKGEISTQAETKLEEAVSEDQKATTKDEVLAEDANLEEEEVGLAQSGIIVDPGYGHVRRCRRVCTGPRFVCNWRYGRRVCYTRPGYCRTVCYGRGMPYPYDDGDFGDYDDYDDYE